MAFFLIFVLPALCTFIHKHQYHMINQKFFAVTGIVIAFAATCSPGREELHSLHLWYNQLSITLN